MPMLPAADEVAPGCWVGAEGTDVESLARVDWTRSGVARHNVIIVTRCFTIECLLSFRRCASLSKCNWRRHGGQQTHRRLLSYFEFASSPLFSSPCLFRSPSL